MKKAILGAVLAVATSSVFAAGTAVCAAPTAAGNGTAIDGMSGFTAANAGTTGFVVNGFTPKCSAKSHVAVAQSETVMAVAAGSAAGSKLFTGTTAGGAVAPTSGSFPNGVGATDATDGVDTALTAAQSS
jgi:uncharacterized protein YdbL (DUF1318 family)